MSAQGEHFELKIKAGRREGNSVLHRGISLHVSSTAQSRKAKLLLLCARIGYTPH